MHPKHRARNLARRRVVVGLITMAAAGSTLLVVANTSSAAGSSTTLPLPSGKSIKVSNADFQAECSFDVAGVDSATNTANTNESAQAGATTLGGYFNNVFTKVTCDVLDANSTQLFEFAPSVNGGVMLQQRATAALPYQPSYILCISGYVKLRNGNDSVIATRCTS